MLESIVNPSETLSIFNAIPGCYLVLLPDAPHFTIIAATDAFLSAIYRTREEVINQGVFKTNPDDPGNLEATGVKDLRASLDYLLQYKTEHRMPEHRYDILNPETGRFEVRIWSPFNVPVLDEKGEVKYIIHSVEDVTDKVRLEQAEKLAHRKLVESERNLRSTILQAPVPICIFRGKRLVIEEANNLMFEFWGRGAEEVLHKPLFEAIPEAKNQGYEELLAEVLETGKPFSANELPVTLSRDGKVETVYVNFSYDPIREPDNSISGIMAMASDVTAQVIARKKIEESEAELKRFKFMADNAEDPFILMRQDGSFAYLNKKALQAWGYTEEEAKHLRVPDVDPGYNDEAFAEVFAKASTGSILHLEMVHRRKDGHIYDVEVNMNAINLGGIPHLFAVARDITERKKAKYVLEQSEARSRLAVESARLGTYDVDLINQSIIYSPRVAEIFGFDNTKQWPYKSFIEAIHPADRVVRTSAHEQAKRTGNLFYEVRIILPDESIRWIRLNGIIRFGDPDPVSIVGTVMDITEERRAADQLEQKIEERTKELKQVNEQLREFTYAASHDLQEPLRKITFYLDRLLSNIEPSLREENKKITERIQHTTGRMRQLINDLLDYSNATEGVKAVEHVDLTKIVKEVLDDMEASITDKDAYIKIMELPSVKGDSRQLQQLFQNLFSNALKYHKKDERPFLQVSWKLVKGENIHADLPQEKRTATFHEVEVKDDGIGFDQDYAERIFKLFQRLHGRAEYEGTGVGLAIVQKVVENHHGYITAASEAGKGASFKVYLPCK